MRLEWLEDILAIAETGSLSDAAARRNLTQSAFSRRVKVIEDHVGAPLFDRARKPLQLHATTADRCNQIAKLADELRQLQADLRQASPTNRTRVVFASQHALTTSLTPDLLRWVGTRASDYYVRLRSANQDECFGLILSRQADLAFVYRLHGAQHLIEADFIETLVLGQDRLIPVYSAERVSDLNERFGAGEVPLIAYPSDVFLGQVMETSVFPTLRHMARAAPRVETALTLAALELAQVGVGVAWVPSSLAQSDLDDERLVDLSRTLPSAILDVTAVRLAGRSGAAQDFIWDHLASISGGGSKPREAGPAAEGP